MQENNNFPITKKDIIIVKCNELGLGFRYDQYNEGLLNGYVDKDTFNKTLREATKLCENSWLKIQDEE